MWCDNIKDWIRLFIDDLLARLRKGLIGERWWRMKHPFVHPNDHIGQMIDDNDDEAGHCCILDDTIVTLHV